MSHDGLGIILIGTCSDDVSIKNRKVLLENLNETLPNAFNLSMRKWNTDSSRHHALHCQIGFLKRPIENYRIFVKRVHAMEFTPISFTIKEVTVVHHRYRSLMPPHQGEFSFQIGSDLRGKIEKGEFIHELNLGNWYALKADTSTPRPPRLHKQVTSSAEMPHILMWGS